MKTLIIYSSRHGTTEKVAALIAEKLESTEVYIINLKFKAKIDFDQFDRIIIGGSIHMGQVQKVIKDFINEKPTSIASEAARALYLLHERRESRGRI
ncbi:hypothetical protein BH23BAC1_BH23BAC1_30750 [soil metagenome]